ncbi:hypothetical protein GCM10022198_15490 [Klugiella xanthotipulae]|uniref:hypothetical protein n=1 Tax=Klugiella xanthotipulae TaxID=244735 RepID=UPI001476BDCF|nr:hypothetical protein [Klugiella xanthotipulae]
MLSDDPLTQRAAIAGICEPRLLTHPETGRFAVEVCQRVTDSFVHRPAETRKEPDVRTLRTGLAYCWSVAVAGCPGAGLPAFESLDTNDTDVAWIVKRNLTKARLKRVLAQREELRAEV